jgi:putative hemolysin
LVSAAEVAYFSLTTKDLDDCAREHPSQAQIISSLLQKPKKLLGNLTWWQIILSILVS